MTQPAAFFMSAVPAFSILGGKLRWILRAGGIQLKNKQVCEVPYASGLSLSHRVSSAFILPGR
jgi:hypothetical protein